MRRFVFRFCIALLTFSLGVGAFVVWEQIKGSPHSDVLFYENRPSMQWSGIELGTHHPIAMWRVRNSTECALNSNEVFFTVNE